MAKENKPREVSERQLAVALGYDVEKDDAPKVLASGRGMLAEAIVNTARKAGVAIREDADLAGMLEQLDVGEHIPPELYQVVAEVLAYIYRMENKSRGLQTP